MTEDQSLENQKNGIIYTVEQLREDRIEQMIKNINNKIKSMYGAYD